MPDREHILHRIRSGLGRHIDQPLSPPPPPRLVVPPMDSEQCVELLLANFPGESVRAGSLAEAREQVSRIVAGRSAVASGAPVLLDAGITSLPGVESGFTDPAVLRDVAANSVVGISSADYALADPGALVLLSSSREDRLISLLPTIHIAVVPSRVVVSGLDELFTVLPDPAEVSSSMVFIAGPSKTGDIEMKLTLGVHGPREIYLVIV